MLAAALADSGRPFSIAAYAAFNQVEGQKQQQIECQSRQEPPSINAFQEYSSFLQLLLTCTLGLNHLCFLLEVSNVMLKIGQCSRECRHIPSAVAIPIAA